METIGPPRQRLDTIVSVPVETLPKSEEEKIAAHRPVQLKTYCMILVMVIANPLGNVLLGRGMKHAGPLDLSTPAHLLHTGVTVFASPNIWLGVASLLTFFAASTLVLSWADYSFVQPVSALGYAVTALLSYFVLNERISFLRCLGIAIICVGVFAVSGTNPTTTAAQPAGEN
jgi:drug/metabolite transporter (DMT)-like permease